MTLYLRLTFCHLAAWTLLTHLNVKKLMVTRFWPLHSIVLICFLLFTGLLCVLDDLERYARLTSDREALKVVQECKESLDKLVIKMDS
jgi:hypothetical protein